jgi:hypothetical protein
VQAELEGSGQSMMPAVRVVRRFPDVKLESMSRICYSKAQNFEFNRRVSDFGLIEGLWLDVLLQNFWTWFTNNPDFQVLLSKKLPREISTKLRGLSSKDLPQMSKKLEEELEGIQDLINAYPTMNKQDRADLRSLLEARKIPLSVLDHHSPSEQRAGPSGTSSRSIDKTRASSSRTTGASRVSPAQGRAEDDGEEESDEPTPKYKKKERNYDTEEIAESHYDKDGHTRFPDYDKDEADSDGDDRPTSKGKSRAVEEYSERTKLSRGESSRHQERSPTPERLEPRSKEHKSSRYKKPSSSTKDRENYTDQSDRRWRRRDD